MAKSLNKETRAVLGTAADKIGTYKEAAGGGTPLPEGTKAPSKKWVEEHRRPQPRNPDGTFGYNSLNARELKYGPSRGVTVPDFLKGIELTFLDKGSVLALKGENSIEYYISTTDMSSGQMVENFKHYRADEKGFAGIHREMMVRKMGRRSKEEIEKGKELEKSTRYWPTSGVIKSKNKPKLGPNTIKRMNMANLNYQAIESQLQGVDAAYLLRNLHLTWGVQDYNKAGATQKDVEDREKWRAALRRKKTYSIPKRTTVTPSIGIGGSSKTQTSSTGTEPATPSYQGKNVSEDKMNKIKGLFKNIIKK